MDRSILLHIGTHKTGSTSIQQFLARAAGQLLEDGILYPRAGRPERFAPHGHHLLAWSIQQKRGLTSFEGWNDVVDEIRRTSCPQVCISSEVFTTCSSDQIRQIQAFLEGADITVLLYLRDPLEYMVSLYKQHITAWGDPRSFREFVKEKIHLCDYRALVRRWRQVLGPEQVIVQSFDECRESEGLEINVLEMLDVEPERYIQFLKQKANVSPTNEQVAVVRRINQMQVQPAVSRGSVNRGFIHRVKRHIIRGTTLGKLVMRLLNGTFASPLYTKEDIRWLHNGVNRKSQTPL